MRLLAGILALSAVALFAVPGIGAGRDYLRDIKPLLEHKCFACHGGLEQKAGLRLDTIRHMLSGGRSGAALVSGNAGQSLLIQKVRESDERKRMPKESGALTAEEIRLLVQWIDGGVKPLAGEVEQGDPRKHWSYQPVRRSPVPRHVDAHNPIDAFLAEQQKEGGIKRAPLAEPEVLLRRVHLDLIGLPPMPEEIAALVRDTSSRNYEDIVDRLLNDPRHGERWGRHWMDVWRYSDWYGRRAQKEIRYSMRHIWRWRDWIVDSVNSDKGYDRMIIEMLAGDEVAPTDPNILPATGFIGHNWYKFDRNVWMFDVVERTSQGLLGLTMRCARCHDHKYDPITQKEYYQFRAFFEPHDVRTDPVDAKQETDKDNKKGAILKHGLSRVFDKHPETKTYLFRRGDDRSPDKSSELLPAVPVAFGGKAVEIRKVALPPEAFYPALHPRMIERQRAFAVEKVATTKAAVRKALDERKAMARRIAGIEAGKLEMPSGRAKFLSDSFEAENKGVWTQVNGRWEYRDGTLAETQVTSFATIVTKSNHPPNFRVKVRYRPLEPGNYRSVGFSFDYQDKGNSQDVYTSTGDARQSVQAFHRSKGKQTYPRAGIVRTELKVGEVATIEAEARGQSLKIWLNGEQKLDYRMPTPRRPGQFALWVHNGAAEFLDLEIIGLEKSLDDLKQEYADFDQRIAAKEKEVAIAEAERDLYVARVAAERARFRSGGDTNVLGRAAALAAAKVQLLTAERDHLIGSDANKSAIAIQDANAALANPATEYEPLGDQFPAHSTGRRTALARWIASPENPRTARVAVNHIWLRHFGEALVPSVANFGVAGKPPTHPKLLDWLAAELVENNWSMKHIHRLIVTSAAYRRSARLPANEGNGQDYARMNSRRMEAELVRDSILHLAGELSFEMGGEDIDDKQGNSVPRRSVYFRTSPDNQMQMASVFDAANPNACYRREESIVPNQSLALFNGGLALDQSRKLAAKLSRDCGADNEQFAKTAWYRILGREPGYQERKLMLEFLSNQRRLLANGKQLDRFAGGGESKMAPSGEPAQRARENLVHALFNHNEFITVR